MPEMGYAPTNKYLPPRTRKKSVPQAELPEAAGGFLGWLDRLLGG
jgi:hypothetical protein